MAPKTGLYIRLSRFWLIYRAAKKFARTTVLTKRGVMDFLLEESCRFFLCWKVFFQIVQDTGFLIFSEKTERAHQAACRRCYDGVSTNLFSTLTSHWHRTHFNKNQELAQFCKLTPPQNGRIPEMQMPVFSCIFMFQDQGEKIWVVDLPWPLYLTLILTKT